MNPPVVENYLAVRERIQRACDRVGRSPLGVRLVAVSKTVGKGMIRQLHAAGHLEFAESRQQEASEKLADLPGDITWHFIGRLQRNKIRRIVADFPWIHSVDSLKIARYLDGIAGEAGLRPRVLLQINLAGEESKGGFGVVDVEADVRHVMALPNLDVCGLMCIPPPTENAEESRVHFRNLRDLRNRLQMSHGGGLPELSMGMSHDYEVAVEEGATLIRVGSSLFGNRQDAACPPESHARET